VSYNPNCDSVTFGVINCVKVNAAYYFIDYAFWIAIVALLALALGALSMLVVNRAGSSAPSPAGRTGMVGSQYAKKRRASARSDKAVLWDRLPLMTVASVETGG